MARSKFNPTQTAPLISTASDATARATTSTSYATLTSAPSVTVKVGANGILQISMTALIWASAALADCYQSFELSGANTLAASDARSISNRSSNGVGLGATFVLTGLTPGDTTVTLRQRVSQAETGNFMNKNLAVEVK